MLATDVPRMRVLSSVLVLLVTCLSISCGDDDTNGASTLTSTATSSDLSSPTSTPSNTLTPDLVDTIRAASAGQPYDLYVPTWLPAGRVRITDPLGISPESSFIGFEYDVPSLIDKTIVSYVNLFEDYKPKMVLATYVEPTCEFFTPRPDMECFVEGDTAYGVHVLRALADDRITYAITFSKIPFLISLHTAWFVPDGQPLAISDEMRTEARAIAFSVAPLGTQ